MKRFSNQEGIAFPLVLLMIIVLLLLAFALSVMGYYEATSALREEHLAKAYYSARGSVAALSKHLTTVPTGLTEEQLDVFEKGMADYVNAITEAGNFAEGSIGGVPYRLNVSMQSDMVTKTGILTLTSTGASGNYSEDAAQQIFYSLVEYKNDGPFGIVDSAIYATVSAFSKGTAEDYWCDAYGHVRTANPDISVMKVDAISPGIKEYAPRNYQLPSDPLFPAITVVRAGFVTGASGDFTQTTTEVKVSGETIYNTKAGMEPTYILIKDLTVNGPLLFNGTAPVFIKVTGTLKINSDIGCAGACNRKTFPVIHELTNCWLGRVNLIYTGTNDIEITGGPTVRANIVSLNAGINATVGGTVNMSGHIICGGGHVWLYGDFENFPSMIYAPFADVQIGGAASAVKDSYHGAIVCNTFSANTLFDVFYMPVTRRSLPLWFTGANAEGELGDGMEFSTGEYYSTNFEFMRWIK